MDSLVNIEMYVQSDHGLCTKAKATFHVYIAEKIQLSRQFFFVSEENVSIGVESRKC